MLGKLAVRNTKRNLKDYLIYLITITISFSLILAFNLIASSDEVVKLSSGMDSFKNVLTFVNIIIVFVVCFLINYTTRFMFEKRSKEFGTYMLLGIKKKEVARLSKQVKGILTVEMSAGQMVEDVRLNVANNIPVEHFGRFGGVIPTPEEIVEALEKQIIGA